MHRFGIAPVVGDKIILNGTTIEEVRDYHREILFPSVDEANKKEANYRWEEQRQKEIEEARRSHYDNANNVMEEIRF